MPRKEESMKQFLFTITQSHGIHARPAGQIANTARQYTSRITLRHGGKEADGKRLLSLMSLGATEGSQLEITVEGADEETAVEAMRSTLETLLGKEVKK